MLADCLNCDSERVALQMLPKHDMAGTYYVAARCPECEVVLYRVLPGEGSEMKETLRSEATLEEGVHDVTVL